MKPDEPVMSTFIADTLPQIGQILAQCAARRRMCAEGRFGLRLAI